MAGFLHTYIPTRVIDSNGISDGASLAFFYSGTSTPAPIYADEALATPLANPVVVPAGAKVPDVYLDEGITYRRVVTPSDGGSVEDTDPWTGFSSRNILMPGGGNLQDSIKAADNGAALRASTSAYAVGSTLVTADGARYEVAPPDSTDHHIVTAGGAKLYVEGGNGLAWAMIPQEVGDVDDIGPILNEIQDAYLNTASGSGNQVRPENGIVIQFPRTRFRGRKQYTLDSEVVWLCDNTRFIGDGPQSELYITANGSLSFGEGVTESGTHASGTYSGDPWSAFNKTNAVSFIEIAEMTVNTTSANEYLLDFRAANYITLRNVIGLSSRKGFRFGSAQFISIEGHTSCRNQRDCAFLFDMNGSGMGHVSFEPSVAIGYDAAADTDVAGGYGAAIVVHRYNPNTVPSGVKPDAGSWFGSMKQFNFKGHIIAVGTAQDGDLYESIGIRGIAYENPANKVLDPTITVFEVLTVDSGAWFEGMTEMINSNGIEDKVDLMSFYTLSNGNMCKGVTLTGSRSCLTVAAGKLNQWHGDTIYTLTGISGTALPGGATINKGSNNATYWRTLTGNRIVVTTNYTASAGIIDERFIVGDVITGPGEWTATVSAVEKCGFIRCSNRVDLGCPTFTGSSWGEFSIIDMSLIGVGKLTYARDAYGYNSTQKGITFAYQATNLAVTAGTATYTADPKTPQGDSCYIGGRDNGISPMKFDYSPRFNPLGHLYEGTTSTSKLRVVFSNTGHAGGNLRVRYAY